MDSKVNYTVVGLFVVVLGIALIWAAFMLTTKGRTKSYLPYVVYMQEAVAGLSEQSPVKFNGVDVGYVVSMQLNPHNLQQVRLLLNIDDTIPITETTTATLMAQGITGITYIGLRAKTADAPLLKAQAGQRYPVIKSEPSLLVQLDSAIRDISHTFKVIGSTFERVFDKQNTLAIKESLANLAKITQTLSNNSERFDQLMQSTSEASKQLPQVMTDVKEALVSAKQTLDEGKTMVENISQQTIPSAQSLLDHLKSIANNLEGFSSELSDNPSLLIRGKTLPPPGPGER